MKNLFLYTVLFFLPLAILTSSFTGKNETPLPQDFSDNFETEQLIQYLESNGNFINSTASGAIISADEVKKNLKNEKYHLIDIRTDTWFAYGHIKGANNVLAPDLLDYFQNKINPSDFDKVILICYSGQSAAFYTSYLRLAGYGNVYSMKWGMSSWRQDFAENSWLKNISDDHVSDLETTANNKPAKGSLPIISTGKSSPEEILKERLQVAFEKPYKDFAVTAADVFANPQQYFILNYSSAKNYELGHIKGAVQYEPFGSLSTATELTTLPTDKKIVVYDENGQTAAAVAAYLNIIGYDAANLAYGSNGFMNKEMSKKGLDAFTAKEINMFPVVE
ncbi:rhodanese-like domain-containing protein [Namhaeicola litoreus]|uniref:Rhodanese-like domain-containing protein n=1 Tax=Namhaeicola litoreus TaxID=1052145 RepID=A0ABW3Y5H9_9FLAO